MRFGDLKRRLTKVRTSARNYLNELVQINNAYISSYFKTNKNIYNRLSIGYLKCTGLTSDFYITLQVLI